MLKKNVVKSKVSRTESNRCLILKALKRFSEKEIWGYSSAGRAPALQAGGQRFDPAYLHQRIGNNPEKKGSKG